MARFAIIAMAIFTFMTGISVFNTINDCYCGVICGNVSYYQCYTNYGYWGIGHKLINYEITPLIPMNGMVVNEKGETLNVTNSNDFNRTIEGLLTYKNPGGTFSLGNLLGFGLDGLTILINTFFLPLKGFPDFLGALGVPSFITIPVFTFIFILMIIGIIEFITSRVNWF